MNAATAAICWPLAATTGHITVTTPLVSGHFPHMLGDNARLRCDLVVAGKFRNGAARSWCRSHQHYWGTKADLARAAEPGEPRCAHADDDIGYVCAPPLLDLRHDMPPPRCTALAIVNDRASGVFSNADIVQINITPPAVQALAAAMRSGQQVGCVDCRRCGHPHLDLGDFAVRAHQRHTCGYCGHDATHSSTALISNPLFPLLQRYGARMQAVLSSVQGNLVL